MVFRMTTHGILVYSGANINGTNNRGDTALHIAAYRGHRDVITALLKAGADVTSQNDKGKTPHQEAVEGGHRQIAVDMMHFSKGNDL